jgi:hypothetical protein
MKNKTDSEAAPAAAPQLVKESEQITRRIEETLAQIAEKEAEFLNIPAQKECILGEIDFDRQALEAVEAGEFALGRELENLRSRVSLLGKKKETALRQEAAGRIEEIQGEAARIIEAEALARARYEEAIHTLIGRAEELASLHSRHGELRYEAIFYVDRYSLTRPNLASLNELPDVANVSAEIAKTFGPVREAGFDSPWVRRRQQLRQRPREQAVASEASPQVQRLPERAVPRIAAKPEHDEDRKPNAVRALLSA